MRTHSIILNRQEVIRAAVGAGRPRHILTFSEGLLYVSVVVACGCDLRSSASTMPITAPTPTVSAVVSGVVRDTVSGQPIPWAEVEWKGLTESWGDRGDGVIADADGAYRLEIRGLGRAGAAEYQIEMRAKKSGYVADTRVVTLSAAADARFDFQLKFESDGRPVAAVSLPKR